MTRQLPNGCAGWHSPWLTATAGQAHRHHRVRRLHTRPSGAAAGKPGAWLRGALAALAVLAAAAAAVSWDAQYVLVRAVKHSKIVAGLEAGIPDVGALIFAALGVALALHGKRALRPRGLNIACVGTSLAMNALASAPGWRDLAIWVMPSAVYALASDTFIGVVRAWAIARQRASGETLAADEEATPIAIIGGIILWTVRLALAPASTVAGFRRWVVEECPVAPGRRALATSPPARSVPARTPAGEIAPAQRPAGRAVPVMATARPRRQRRGGQPGKQDRLLTLAAQRHDLATLPLGQVSGIANQIGAEISLSPGTARRVLLAHVRALHNGSSPAPEAAS